MKKLTTLFFLTFASLLSLNAWANPSSSEDSAHCPGEISPIGTQPVLEQAEAIQPIVLALTQANAAPLDPTKIKKIYYTLASAQGAGRSSFGHAYLRISESELPSPEDKVIEFTAAGSISSLRSYLEAMGLGEKFDRKISMEPYSTVTREINFFQLRDLKSYELKLTEEQRSRVVRQVNSLIKEGKFGKYSFFSENCASAVTEILKAAGIPLHSSLSNVIPSAIPEVLQSKGLVASVTEDDNADSRRLHLYEKYAEALQSVAPEVENLKSYLTSHSPDERVAGFALLLDGVKERPLPSVVANYLNAFQFLESRLARIQLSRALKGERSLVAETLPRMELELLHRTPRIVEKSLERSGDEFFLKYKVAFNDPDETENSDTRAWLRVPLNGVTQNSEGELFWKGIRVGHQTDKAIHGSSYVTDGVSFLPRIQGRDSKWSVETLALIQDVPPSHKTLSSSASPDLIPLRNDDASRPACNGFVDLQKGLLQRTIFDPSAKPLSRIESLQLVRGLLEGKIIVVPGYSDASSWLSSLDQSSVRDELFQYNHARYASVLSAVSNYFSGTQLKTEQLLTIGQLARKGLYTPIYQRVSGNEGHAILVLDVQDEGKNLRLTAYDPNLGYVRDLFYFDKEKQKLHSTLYPDEPLFARKLDLEQELDHEKLVGPHSSNLLKLLAQQSGQHSFSSDELAASY